MQPFVSLACQSVVLSVFVKSVLYCVLHELYDLRVNPDVVSFPFGTEAIMCQLVAITLCSNTSYEST